MILSTLRRGYRALGGASGAPAPRSAPPAQLPERPTALRTGGLRLTGEIRRFGFHSDFFDAPCCEIEVDGKILRYVEGNRLALKRVQSLFTKEPTTIPWLETIGRDETLVDIGANVGMYSIYAGAVVGCRVFSFEPEALNYAELNKNVFVNGLHDRLSAFCIALSDECKVDYLRLGAFGIAYSHHDFGESTWTEDKHFGEKVTPMHRRLLQGSVSATLDGLVADRVVPPPQHIKIDVDGLENRVVRGCGQTLRSPELRSILVEIDHRLKDSDFILNLMAELGWRYSTDQLRANRKKILTVEEIEAIRRKGVGGFNYIFYRDPFYDRFFRDFLEAYSPPWAA